MSQDTAKSEIFVFGSNLAGRHGKGAALAARKNHGAIYGRGRGLQGKSYAIPTKDAYLNTRSLDEIKIDIEEFVEFAKTRPDLFFRVTEIGCGLAGYEPQQIAPLFPRELPSNIQLPERFLNEL